MKKENIVHNGKTIATIVYNEKVEPGVYFYGENDNSLQMGRHYRLKGEIIKPHKHLSVKIQRDEILKEVLYIERGKVRVNFYDDNWKEIDSRILNLGDIILLIKGGHGFEILEETVMIEIKEGPYNPASTQKRD